MARKIGVVTGLLYLKNSLESACLHPNITRLKSSFPRFEKYLMKEIEKDFKINIQLTRVMI